MPKMKTHKGARKRFKISASGKIRRRKAFHNHNLDKKGPIRRRRLRGPDVVAGSDEKRVRKMLGRTG